MNIEEFRNYCLQKYGATEEFPFDENTLVFKVMGKIYIFQSLTVFSVFHREIIEYVGSTLSAKSTF